MKINQNGVFVGKEKYTKKDGTVIDRAALQIGMEQLTLTLPSTLRLDDIQLYKPCSCELEYNIQYNYFRLLSCKY